MGKQRLSQATDAWSPSSVPHPVFIREAQSGLGVTPPPSLHSPGGSVVITHSPRFLPARKEPGRGSIKRSNINTLPSPPPRRGLEGAAATTQPRPTSGAAPVQREEPGRKMGLAMEHGGPYSRAGGSPRGCWYYMRYFFLFLSLIQFLIILGLVLFMVYGNVHVSTESNLQATERRADGLYGQVMGLTASQANLSKELNLTTRARDAIMQMLLSARREQDRINSSFRQCQADRVRLQARHSPWEPPGWSPHLAEVYFPHPRDRNSPRQSRSA